MSDTTISDKRLLKVSCLLTRKEGTTHEEFHRYWTEKHTPMLSKPQPGAPRAVSARCESMRDSHKRADLIQGAGWMEVGMDGQAIINGSAFAGTGRG